MTVTSLLVATSADEAVEAMAEGARPVAGGTDLVVGARQGKAALPDRLVAIHRIDELAGVASREGSITLGALTTHETIASDPQVLERLTALADASAIVGSHATRAWGTIGGNVMNASPAMETGGPLVSFDATASLRSRSGTRSIPVADLFTGPGATVANSDELLVALEVPVPRDGTGSCYLRLEYRRQMEIAVVGVTAVASVDGDRVTDARVAITALAPTVRRVPEAEAALVSGDAEGAAAAVAAAAAPISDVRASDRYRRAMAGVIARRAIDVALARARGDVVPVPANQRYWGSAR